MLHQELAQAIVNRTMEILGKNINLMNNEGIIIASGDQSRVGTFHEGAARAVKQMRPVIIWPQDVNNLTGVRPGINLPIRLNNNIVGVVGITGDPAEVRNYGELVRITVELMLEQALLKEQVEIEYYARENLVQDLITGRFAKNQEMFLLRAYSLGFRLELPRAAIVIAIEQLNEAALSYLKKQAGGEIYLHRLRKSVVDTMSKLLNSLDIVSFAGADKFVVFKHVNPNQLPSKRYQELYRWAERIREQIKRETGLSTTIGLGNYHPGLSGLQQSFQEGLSALNLGRLRTREANKANIYHINELAWEEMLSSIPLELRSSFVTQVLGELKNKKSVGSELITTMEQYFASKFNLSAAAQSLFLHRNTLRSRLQKIKSLTGLDPTAWPDAVVLYTAIVCDRFNKLNHSVQNGQDQNHNE